MIFGISLETTIGTGSLLMKGTVNMIIIYFVSGIGGNLFSSLLSDNIGNKLMTLAVGASTCIFGIIASYLGFLTLNWKGIKKFLLKLWNQLNKYDVNFYV